MSVLNPFQVSRSHLHSHAQQLHQWIASGHTQLPSYLQTQRDEHASRAGSDSSPAAAAAAAASSSSSSSSASVIYPPPPDAAALRAPCFYQLFPQLWKKGRKARPNQPHSSTAASSSSHASSASIAAVSTSASAAAAAHDNNGSDFRTGTGTALSNPAQSSIPSSSPSPKLKLRARSPSLSLMDSLGACHSRLQHEAGFAEALSLATPHVSAQLSNVNPNNQLEDGAPNDAVQPISPTIPPGSSLPPLEPSLNSLAGALPGGSVTGPRTTLHRRASKFHKPVGEMGDYTTLMRNTVYLRNPYIDQLDDPAFVAYITHNLQMAAREKQQQQQQQQQMLMHQGNDGQMQDTGSATADSKDKPPTRLTVDEADLSEEGAGAGARESSSSVPESLSAPPSPQFRRGRNRNPNGSIGRNIPRVSFQQFVQNKANAANSVVPTLLPATPASIGEESMDASMTSGETLASSSQVDDAENSNSDTRESKRTKLNNSTPATSSNTTGESTTDSATVSTPTTPVSNSSSSSIAAASTTDEFTPSISSLVSSMLQQQQQAKANAQARAAANRDLSALATVSLPPGDPATAIILERLRFEVPTPAMKSLDIVRFKTYTEAVNVWFVQQLLDLRSSRSCNEQAFGSSHVVPPQLERTYEMAYDKWNESSIEVIVAKAASNLLIDSAVAHLSTICTWKKIKMIAMSAVVANALSSA